MRPFMMLLFWATLVMLTPAEDGVPANYEEIRVMMPNITLVKDDVNVCMAARIPSAQQTSYMTRIEIITDQEFDGDIIVTVCEDIGIPHLEEDGTAVWDCSPNRFGIHTHPPLTRGVACKNGGEAKSGSFAFYYMPERGEDPVLSLPQGTGVAIGGRTGVRYVVADVNFYSRKQEVYGFTGTTEVRLTQRQAPMKSVHAIELDVKSFLGPKSDGFVAGSWIFGSDFPPITIVSVTGHSHKLSNELQVEIEKKDGSSQVIARQDPRNPNHQTDMSPDLPAVLEAGDKLTVTCMYNTSFERMERVGLNRFGETCVVFLYNTSDEDVANIPPYVAVFDHRFDGIFRKIRGTDDAGRTLGTE